MTRLIPILLSGSSLSAYIRSMPKGIIQPNDKQERDFATCCACQEEVVVGARKNPNKQGKVPRPVEQRIWHLRNQSYLTDLLLSDSESHSVAVWFRGRACTYASSKADSILDSQVSLELFGVFVNPLIHQHA